MNWRQASRRSGAGASSVQMRSSPWLALPGSMPTDSAPTRIASRSRASISPSAQATSTIGIMVRAARVSARIPSPARRRRVASSAIPDASRSAPTATSSCSRRRIASR